VRPWTVSRLKQVARVDRDLAAMIDHYRAHRDPERPWRLVIAGDLVDFIGMNIAPARGSASWLELSDEERSLGLGSTSGAAAVKMKAVAKRHHLAFKQLAAFVADGNSVVLVRGNHDVDFHWKTAQRAFIDALVERAPVVDADFESRIEFYPWFYYEEGLFYVEHGHQYDPMCSYDYVLEPVSPRDPLRICWSFSDILLRSVCRPTPGLSAEGHENMGLSAYVRLAFRMGIGGAFKLGYRYVRAISLALMRWRIHLSVGARKVRARHERRMQEISDRTRLGMDKLRALAALSPRPITRGGLEVLRSVFVDQLALCALLALFAALMFAFAPWTWAAVATVLATIGTAGYMRYSSRVRRRDVNPTSAMRKGAARIAQLFPSRFVVMGHTHVPITETIEGTTTTYVNLGGWAVDDLDGPPHEASRTHMVIRWVGGHPTAQLLRWDTDRGPTRVATIGEGYEPPLTAGLATGLSS
jgi:UDP-2,3-diacylglucosamine pyrophosphatase LpxH